MHRRAGLVASLALAGFIAGCATPYTTSLIETGMARSIAASSPRWGHMTPGEAVQMLQDVYRDLDRVSQAVITSNRMEVVCILDIPEAHPTRRTAFDWAQVTDIAVYRQDWKDGRATYDLHVRYTKERGDDRPPATLEYGIGHTLSPHSFSAAAAADLLCALYALTGKTPGAGPAAGRHPKETGQRPAGPTRASDIEKRLQQLKELHEKGLVTDEAFREKQKDILEGL